MSILNTVYEGIKRKKRWVADMKQYHRFTNRCMLIEIRKVR